MRRPQQNKTEYRSADARRRLAAEASDVPRGCATEGGAFEAVLIGPNTLFREGLTRILKEADFRILASAYHFDDAMVRTLPRDQSVLLIIDVSDDFDGAAGQIESFKRQCPAGRVAVLAGQYHLIDILSAFRAGAHAYLVRALTCGTFIKSLELVMLGETTVSSGIVELIGDHQNGLDDDSSNGNELPNRGRYRQHHEHANDERDDDPDNHARDNGDKSDAFAEAWIRSARRLSARQQAILEYLIQGDSNKTIARKIAITEATVKVHVKAILRKIRVHNRTQAAIWAIKHGHA